MNILLNGEPTRTVTNVSLASLIEDLELAEKRLAVEVNEEVVPRSRYDVFLLREGDKVEIVHAIGGG